MSMTLTPLSGPMAVLAPGWCRSGLVTGGFREDQGRPAYGRMRVVVVPALRGRQRLFRLAVAFFDQLFELFILHAEALGYTLFVSLARGAGGLFDKLPDIVAKNRNRVVDFRWG